MNTTPSIGAASSVANLATLAACEETIERAESDAWKALRRIHDEELWRADGQYGTWQNYVEQRWGFTKSRAHRLIDSAKLIEHFKAQGIATLPTCEAHTRPLVRLRRAGRQERSDEEFLNAATFAWERAVETAPEKLDAPVLTAKHVESTVEHYAPAIPKQSKAGMVDLRQWLARGSTLLKRLGHPGKLDCKALGPHFEGVLHWMIDADQERPR